MATMVEMLTTLHNGQQTLLNFEAKFFDILTGGNVHAINILQKDLHELRNLWGKWLQGIFGFAKHV